MYRTWPGGHGYRRGGFFWPGLLLLGLFLLAFGKFLWPLFLLFFIVPFIFRSKWGYWGRYDDWHAEKRKRYDDDFGAPEKPKRGDDGDPVEII